MNEYDRLSDLRDHLQECIWTNDSPDLSVEEMEWIVEKILDALGSASKQLHSESCVNNNEEKENNND